MLHFWGVCVSERGGGERLAPCGEIVFETLIRGKWSQVTCPACLLKRPVEQGELFLSDVG